MFNTLLLMLTAVVAGCGGGGDDPQPATPTITVSHILGLPPISRILRWTATIMFILSKTL